MFTENDIVKDASHTKNVTNWMGLCGHVLDIYDLRSYIPWSSAPYEKVIRIIGYCCQSKINNNGLFAQNDIIWL